MAFSNFYLSVARTLLAEVCSKRLTGRFVFDKIDVTFTLYNSGSISWISALLALQIPKVFFPQKI